MQTTQWLGIGIIFSACAALAATPAHSEKAGNMDGDVKWEASWIWQARDNYTEYNDTIEARSAVTLPELASAVMRITADTRYRLYINEEWVNDGPSRGWPHHYQYDALDVTPYLRPGVNTIRIIAKFFGIGTFHQIPQEAGLLAQLNAVSTSGEALVFGTDEQWEVRRAAAWLRNAPKQSVQMGPYEYYDARLEESAPFEKAVARYAADAGPWKNLEARDCPLLTRIPFPLKALTAAHLLRKPQDRTFIFPTAAWQYGGVVYSNNRTAVTGAFATVLEVSKKTVVTVDADGNAVLVEGKRAPKNRFELSPGRHLLYCALTQNWGHWRHDTEIRIEMDASARLRNPITDAEDAPWCYLPESDAGNYQCADYRWPLLPAEERDAVSARIKALADARIANAPTAAQFADAFGGQVRMVAADEALESPHYLFGRRETQPDKQPKAEALEALVDGGGPVVIHPSADGDVELVYDLGEQNVGYYAFAIEAEAGLVVDISGVEYIAPDGRVQHTERYRNGMRYICKEGENHFLSFMRRSQRYLFITLRNQTRPARLLHFQLFESTYPVQHIGRFACSDGRLNRIWEISERTLKLCTEDTFTDCPLYEQTLWIGDARNEAVFGYTAYGSDDIARRCIRLGAFSLDLHPLVLSQVPSTWETILPAWSFLWGIMVWDHYEYTGDKEFLAWVYPYMMKNLENAHGFRDERGLFSAPFWNMFDWSGIDDGHDTVLHNSMFMIGAMDAARRCAEALGDTAAQERLTAWRDEMALALNQLWNEESNTYPDSVHNDGSVSGRTSIHTAFLALLYDIARDAQRERLIAHLLDTPEGMTRVGSPFAIMYLYEALEKTGHADRIIQSIYESYQPMLDLDATTVWETFAGATNIRKDFPTRSHTHAWSSAPIHFLNRIVLGIVPEAPAGAAFRISPRLNGLEWAEGATASIKGPVTVSWRREGDTLEITAAAPDGAALRFVPNDTHAGLRVRFNGHAIEQ